MDEVNKRCIDCPYADKIAEHDKDLERNRIQHKEFFDRFEKINTDLAVSSERYINLITLVTEIRASVNELKDKPGKRWDNMTTTVLTSIVTLILGAILGKYIHF